MNCPHATLEEETMRNRDPYSRRDFIRTSGALAGTVLAHHCAQPLLSQASEPPTKVSAHIWVYASKYPPNWDATPDLDRDPVLHPSLEGTCSHTPKCAHSLLLEVRMLAIATVAHSDAQGLFRQERRRSV